MDLHIKRANKITSKDWIFLTNSSQVITAHLVKNVLDVMGDGSKLKIITEDSEHLTVDKRDFILSA